MPKTNPISQCNGINLELISWLKQYAHLEKILPDIKKDFTQDLIPAICSRESRERAAHSKEIIKILWYKQEVLGPYPFLDTLSEFEFDRKFYANYRDHASHQLKVYLLGLYFFEKSSIVKQSILKEINIDDPTKAIEEFHLRWLVTAVYHDIGYVIENGETDAATGEAWNKTKNVLNEALHTPLSFLPQFKKWISKDSEKLIIKRQEFHIPSVDSPMEIEGEKNCDYFDLLKEYSINANVGLSNGGVKSPLRSYYDYAFKTNPTDNRPRFRDHGIASSLLLLKVWRSFKKYILKVSAITNEEHLTEATPSILSLNKALEDSENTIIAAASAISLHNINKDIWDLKDTLTHGLTLKDFSLRLEYGNGKNPTPLGFLLGLVDSIQCWDRPMFNTPTTESKHITDEDITMYSENDKICISFVSDLSVYKSPKNASESLYSKLLKGMERYIAIESVNKIIDCGGSKRKREITKKVKRHSKTFKTVKKSTLILKVPTEMKPSNEVDVFKLIELNSQWLVGAVNFDEDLHFSSFYLYQSWKHKLPSELSEFGYTCLIACFKDFREKYYIPENECQRVAEALINTMKLKPLWFNSVLDKIKIYADELSLVFPFNPDSYPFKNMADYDLLKYYSLHNLSHTKLYQYSRLPEALDRGKNYFTNYLREYLKNLHEDFLDNKILNGVFEIFTFPEEESIAGTEFSEFIEILSKIKNDSALKELFGNSSKQIYLSAEREILKEISEHREKWTFWNYHGYGSRTLRDINSFLEKFRHGIHDESMDKKVMNYKQQFIEGENKRMEYFNKYKVDEITQILFRLYSKIGTTKLYRRYIQLKNFYFLDQLIAKISDRFGQKEELIRNLLPQEIEKLLKNDFTIMNEHRERVNGTTFVLNDTEETILVGEKASLIRERLADKTKIESNISEVLTGMPLIKDTEIFKGHCRVIERTGDVSKIHFTDGDVLVCDAGDPDYFELMDRAGVVLIEQGGVTSHASIRLTERKIKSIIGISGLLANIYNNDLVEIDTQLGIVRKLNSSKSDFVITPQNVGVSKFLVGAKAFNLIALTKQGINTPIFFCIPLNSLRPLIQKGTQDSIGGISQALWDTVDKNLNLLNSELYALRSSYSNEDTSKSSGAGINRSELHVSKEDVINLIISMASDVFFSGTNELSGSIIVQEMVLGDFSGILFTQNPFSQNGDMLLEAIPGGNELLTGAKEVVPVQYTIDKKSKSIKEIENNNIWKQLLNDNTIGDIFEIGQTIEDNFNSPQNIEWTMTDETVHILQTRPIIKDADLKKEYNPDIISKRKNDIISIYRSYRVPENLQRHMLQVAGIGKWLIDNWKGETIHYDDITTTLLLHDILNIIKDPYTNLSNTFPEGYKRIAYWRAVQQRLKQRYGNSDVQAVISVAEELGANDRVLFLLKNKQFVNNEYTLNSSDFELKICSYADQRVSPYGILPIRRRLEEAVIRYKGIKSASINNPDREKLIVAAEEIEKQLFKFIEKNPDEIHDINIAPLVKQLRNYHL